MVPRTGLEAIVKGSCACSLLRTEPPYLHRGKSLTLATCFETEVIIWYESLIRLNFIQETLPGFNEFI
jgi:hypothetical protein